MTTSRDLRIIAQAASATSGENPYTKLLYEGMATRPVRIIPYTRHAVATQSPDVIHIHWPEFLVRWDAGHATMIADVLKEYLLLKTAKARGARIVWTAHDLGAHDRPNASLRQTRRGSLFRFAGRSRLCCLSRPTLWLDRSLRNGC
ncbi:hypothetical protein U1737_20085 [Sphingomonas sp. LB3N6]|uniref:hypothetical protein n=1 Tax=Sphingomonas fucosidasi TaxID=3096164 RepID=UPI002FC7E9BC